MRRSSDPQLSPSATDSPPELPAPPLGSRSAHSSPAHRAAYPTRSAPSETAGGGYCDLRPGPGGGGGAPPKPPAKSYVEPENRPLEMSVLKRVKELLAEVDSRTAAKHITLLDCKVARIVGVSCDMQRMMGVASGLELLTLPHGHQLRMDLLERFYTMSIMVAVDLLGCTGSTEERAALLHKTIQLAAELKSSMGNMFGFAAVMRALEIPQISSGADVGEPLRQRPRRSHPKKQRAVPPRPFPATVVPVLGLLERSVPPGDGGDPCESPVEAGVDVVMCHLEAARGHANATGPVPQQREAKLQGFQERADVLEVFQTEFQMRLLWGSRGSEGNQSERYEKFDKVLTALSHKLEPPVRQSEL
ncbi:hypothetical protein CRUP_007841 [Coryphaenoides rupestris]|nr:hypothetical protein CRUP_007841 [Coryphaenoides rupestris]